MTSAAFTTPDRAHLLRRGLRLEYLTVGWNIVRRTGEALASRALIADSQQTFACWYLSATTLAGLTLNAVFGLWWADPVAALVIVLFLVREGIEALRGEDD